MNDFTEKICPYCKTKFIPGDDIIVCSECDMPHHKDCWVENQGCTTFGCLGTIKSADNTASSVITTHMNYYDFGNVVTPVNNGVVFCTQCNTQNANTSSFCSNCGNNLTNIPAKAPSPPVYTQAIPYSTNQYSYAYQQITPYQVQVQYQSNGHTTYQTYPTTDIDTDIQQLVGINAEYYIPKFQTMKFTNKSTSWNWSAFLATPYWMMYRKMYGYAVAVLAADIIISMIGSVFLSLLALVGYVAFGFLGNSIYMKHLEGKANQAKAINEPYKSQFIASNGGVNTIATVLAIIGRALLVIILLI